MILGSFFGIPISTNFAALHIQSYIMRPLPHVVIIGASLSETHIDHDNSPHARNNGICIYTVEPLLTDSPNNGHHPLSGQFTKY